jgi:hypothetical protein
MPEGVSPWHDRAFQASTHVNRGSSGSGAVEQHEAFAPAADFEQHDFFAATGWQHDG